MHLQRHQVSPNGELLSLLCQRKVTKERRPRFRVFFAMKLRKKFLAHFGFVRRCAELTFARDQARKFKHRPSLALTNPAVLSAPQGTKVKTSNDFAKSFWLGGGRVCTAFVRTGARSRAVHFIERRCAQKAVHSLQVTKYLRRKIALF
jgi:hypothetical protein